jgi:predicted permease
MAGTWITRLLDAVRARLGASAPERDMDEEMRFHLEMATRRNLERGLAPAEAQRVAFATFGGLAQQQEAAREGVPGHWVDELRQDLRYAVRTLRRNPGFATSVVLTLALGIGANSAIFSVVNGVLLRPLPVRDPGKLTYIGWNFGRGGGPASLSPFKMDYVRRHSTAFAGLTTYRTAEYNLGTGANARPVQGLRVAPEFFAVIGMSPVIGRGFVPEEEKPGGPPAVVLSDALWQSAFGADRRVIGSSVRLDDTTYTIVGVLSPSFWVPGNSRDEIEYVVPLQLVVDPSEKGNNYMVLARMRSERSREQVLADLDAVGRSFVAEHPELAAEPGESYRLAAYEDLYIGGLRRTLLILLGAVTFVLLIAAANAANLLLARAAAREREIVVRTALGAKRGRIVRQLLSEGIVLSAIAGALGLALGTWAVRIMLALMPRQLPRADEIGLDYRVLGFTAGIVILTGLVFGLAAATPTRRLNLASVLGERALGAGGRQRSRDFLVMTETAFAIVLLAGAGLLLSSFARLRRIDPGFTAENVTAVRFGRMPDGYQTMDAIWQFEQQLIDRLSLLPGIQGVAGLPNFPLERGWNMPVALTGVAESGDGDVEYRWVTPSYFETLRIPVAQGRGFAASDDRKAPRVAIVNESMARRYFPAGNALGSRIDVGRYKDQWIGKEFEGSVEIVGIVGDIREIGLARPPKRTVYVPMAQAQDRVASSPLFVIRAAPGTPLRTAVEDAVRSIDPRLTPSRLESMPEIVGASIAEQRFETTLLTLFAGTALALTAIGIFGVVAYGVQQRVREIGVRVALGASSGEVLRLIVGRSLRFVVGGAMIGVLGALGLTRLMSSILYEVTATDPLTFSLAVATLLGVALVASYLPARRATRIDPVRALRLE